ncbi:MAG: hypothetical protein J5695_04985 [Bacteroidales bacterium]|nr:hypothetical protein [Bacteroidales bacterium]
MKRVVSFLLCLMTASLITGCAAAQNAPKGKLIYCSYSETRVAGLGKSYCELIADTDSIPKVHVVLDHDCMYAPERSATYEVDASLAAQFKDALEKNKVYELNGYYVEENITGGTIYRIYMEYDSGEKINARWYGHDISPDAEAAYGLIYSLFAPWRSQAEAIGVPSDPDSINN